MRPAVSLRRGDAEGAAVQPLPARPCVCRRLKIRILNIIGPAIRGHRVARSSRFNRSIAYDIRHDVAHWRVRDAALDRRVGGGDVRRGHVGGRHVGSRVRRGDVRRRIAGIGRAGVDDDPGSAGRLEGHRRTCQWGVARAGVEPNRARRTVHGGGHRRGGRENIGAERGSRARDLHVVDKHDCGGLLVGARCRFAHTQYDALHVANCRRQRPRQRGPPSGRGERRRAGPAAFQRSPESAPP